MSLPTSSDQNTRGEIGNRDVGKYSFYGKYIWDITVYFGCTILCVGQGHSLLIFDVEQTQLLHREYFGSEIVALTFKTPSPLSRSYEEFIHEHHHGSTDNAEGLPNNRKDYWDLHSDRHQGVITLATRDGRIFEVLPSTYTYRHQL